MSTPLPTTNEQKPVPRKELIEECDLAAWRQHIDEATGSTIFPPLVSIILEYRGVFRFQLGPLFTYDARDSHGHWYHSIIVARRGSDVLVHFKNWRPGWNEWISVNNPDRINVCGVFTDGPYQNEGSDPLCRHYCTGEGNTISASCVEGGVV
jgi:hypothetical protein